MDILNNIQFWALFVPIATAVAAWFANEARKQATDEYLRKEKKYLELIASTRGFHEGAEPTEAKRLKNAFLSNLDSCWLYCPDEVIRAANCFLDSTGAGTATDDVQRKDACGELVRLIRNDLLGSRFLFFPRTKLRADEYRILKVT